MAWQQQQATRHTDGAQQASVVQVRRHYCFLIIGVLAAFVAAFICGWLLLTSPRFAFRQVHLYRQGHHTTIAEITYLLAQQQQQNFFAMNTHRLHQQLMLLPWVKQVAVRRVWPDRLDIVLKEKRAIAVWNEEWLLDEQKKPFHPPMSSFPQKLPILSAESLSPEQVWGTYQNISQLLGQHQLVCHSISEESPSSWRIDLQQQTQIHVAQKHARHILARWLARTGKKLLPRMQQIARIDLRYNNGMAIQWRHPSSHQHDVGRF